MLGRTIRDVTVNYPDYRSTVTIPAGTQCLLIKGADGMKGDLWAVRSIARLIELTGNSYDPHYRYCWIDAQHIETE